MTSVDSAAVIRATSVRRLEQPILIDCGDTAHAGSGSMAVIPLIDGDRIRAFEVRCQCGAAVIVECLYEEVKP